MGFSTPRSEEWIFSIVRGRTTAGIRTLLALQITPSTVISSDLKFKYAARSTERLYIRLAMDNIRYKMRKDCILGGGLFNQFKSVIHVLFGLRLFISIAVITLPIVIPLFPVYKIECISLQF